MSSSFGPYDLGYEWCVQKRGFRFASPLRCIATIILGTAFLSTAATLSWSASTHDAELLLRNSARMAEIMSKVAQPGGRVSKAVHAEFWALIPASVRDNPRE